MSTIEFRSLTGKDVNELFDLLNSLSEEAKKFFHPHPFDKRTLKQIGLSKKDHYFVLTVNKKIIGYSMLRLFGYEIPSYGACIRNGYERQGYGMMLTERTIQKVIELGYKEMILTVHKDNIPAIKLYEKTGFKKILTNHKTTEIKMKKSLAPKFFF